ncbi:MAG: hypothetical protein IH789_07550 [Acidobacteria bacterium]|nr:hypothetical protein [Acidobacteriota bacterium]
MSILASCGGAAPIEGIKVTPPISLLDLLPQARVAAIVPGKLEAGVEIREVSVEEKSERVFFFQPGTELIFPLRIEQAAVLETAVALLSDAWEKGGDGVTFYVAVRREGEIVPAYLFSQHVHPRIVPEQRGWQPVRLDLTSLRDTDIELILGTHPGPNIDPTYDWAVWKDPRLYNPAIDPQGSSGPQRE